MLLALHTLVSLLGVPSPMSAAVPASHADHRWGRWGHRIIARVAADQLSPEARRAVRRLLGGRSLAEISTWADEVRSERPATASWHYVNIPVWEEGFRPELCPAAGCVIGTLEDQQRILADHDRTTADRAEALRWVVHLVGDLHMPLHVGDRGDRGGNDVKLVFNGRQTNLHSLWDTGVIESSGRSEEAFVVMLRDVIRRRGDLAVIASGSVTDWAMESHRAARDVAYGFLPQSLVLDDRYADIARPVIEDRLLRASVRLAALLERALDDE